MVVARGVPCAGALADSDRAAWQDARFGTIANVLILVPAIIAALFSMPVSSYRAIYAREVRTRLATPAGPAPVVTEQDLVPLPAVVQRYLRFMGVVGRPRVPECARPLRRHDAQRTIERLDA